MTVSFSLEDIQRLPIAERIKLVGDIWDSIAASEEAVPLSEAQRLELQRRLAEYERDPGAGKTWEEVKKSLGR
ncbi:MAG: addiction module protein [Planctomycetes bacterium]|nr:addiction module protein [Planctomycetota bacterium]